MILGLNHTATLPGAYLFAVNRYHHHVATNTWLGENISSAINNNRLGLDHYSINLHRQNEILSMKITGPTLFFSFIEILLEHIHFYI